VAQAFEMPGNPTPITLAQIGALVAASARELTWTLPQVSREVRAWRARALQIPPGPLRDDALTTLTRERLNTEGAALFGILPRRRRPELVRLLARYQVLLDYLDTISERPAPDPLANGRQLHVALTEALDPSAPLTDHYRFHAWADDGGYLRALIQACREGCEALPSYGRVQTRVMRAGTRAAIQVLNHDPNAGRRDAALAAWARAEFPDETRLSWFELTAACSSSLWIHALLALAADPELTASEVEQAETAYFPWVCAASTLLDAFVDQAEDAVSGHHNYLAHYDSLPTAVRRIEEIVSQSALRARGLTGGTRHALIATGMVAMYLTKETAASSELRTATAGILAAAGTLPRLQLPIMRTMRVLRKLTTA
jgi:tetraprenyl-beta-curcumene synthase